MEQVPSILTAQSALPRSSALAGARRQILLVEDQPGHVKLAERSFQSAEDRYQLLVADRLEVARRLMEQAQPALIMADLLLPDGRGTELLQAASAPLIVLTSHGDEQSAVQALKAGAIDYVVKSDALWLELPRVADRALREWEHIQARHRAEQALRESEARFRSIFEHEPECVSLHDRQGRVQDINPAGLAMLECDSLEQLQALPFEAFLEETARSEFLQAVKAVFRGEMRQMEFALCGRRGTVRQLESNMVPLLVNADKVDQMLAVTRDITQRRRAEERSQELWLQLAHLNRLSSMGEMASTLAHEVNQPLGAIANYAGTCAALIDNDRWRIEDVRKSLDKINEQALRAGTILARLKSFVSKAAPLPVALDVVELIQGVLQLMKLDAHNLGARIEFTAEPDLPRVSGDCIQLQQVLVNLIRNGLEAMQHVPTSQRRLSIAARRSEKGVVVQVVDAGSGIPSERLNDLFEPYVTTKAGGLGMGLSISRSIVAAHGGRLWAANNSGGGATLSFELAATPERHETAR